MMARKVIEFDEVVAKVIGRKRGEQHRRTLEKQMRKNGSQSKSFFKKKHA